MCTYLKPCATRSPLPVQGEVWDLLDRIDLSTANSTGTAKLSSDIAVHLISMKGARYLCGINDGEQLLGYSNERKEVLRTKIPSYVVAIRFTIAFYKIRRIQFQGQDDSSKWIGDGMLESEDSNWTRIIRTQKTISRLLLLWGVGICTAVS